MNTQKSKKVGPPAVKAQGVDSGIPHEYRNRADVVPPSIRRLQFGEADCTASGSGGGTSATSGSLRQRVRRCFFQQLSLPSPLRDFIIAPTALRGQTPK